ncbi:MAG: ribbon-helix-helix protein, CopG family [Candidatus Altiarchaeota archaeon]|nr:ribbon-helix-helix protein, CopG family [Candidatus Altiarchaeota archaeon]
MSVMLSMRITEDLLEEIDKKVKDAGYKNRSEAVKEALKLFVREYPQRRVGKVMHETAFNCAYELGRKDATSEALAYVIRHDDMQEIERRIEEIAKRSKGKGSLTRAVTDSHEEDET